MLTILCCTCMLQARSQGAERPKTAGDLWGLKPGDQCPLRVFIDGRGRVYDSRFAGRYRVSQQTLQTDVAGGCKESGQTSSVRVQVSAQTTHGRVAQVLSWIRDANPKVPVMLVDPLPHGNR